MDETGASTITISRERYLELLDAEAVLAALDAGGVEDWTWYDASLEDYRRERGVL